jgi:hypothetical protein
MAVGRSDGFAFRDGDRRFRLLPTSLVRGITRRCTGPRPRNAYCDSISRRRAAAASERPDVIRPNDDRLRTKGSDADSADCGRP